MNKGSVYTLLGAVLVGASFALTFGAISHIKSEVHNVGGVVAKGIMPHNIPPATAIPGSFDERFQLATASK